MYGQPAKVGINAARISQELRNKIWREDELLKEMGMVGDSVFLDTNPDDIGLITRPNATPDEDLEADDDVHGADREVDVQQDAEGSDDDGDDLDDYLAG